MAEQDDPREEPGAGGPVQGAAGRRSRLAGIEELLSLAAVDRRFADELIADRRPILRAMNPPLSPNDARILAAIGDSMLRQMISSLRATRQEQERRAFMVRSAATLTALVGGGALATASGCERNEKGKMPDTRPRAPDSGQTPKLLAFAPRGKGHDDDPRDKDEDSLSSLLGGTITGTRPDSPGGYGRVHRRIPAARVIMGPVKAKGGIASEIIRRIIRRHINEIKYCYQKAMMENRKLGGKMTVAFTIEGSGQVQSSSVKVSSKIRSQELIDCVTRCFRRWLFPTPSDGKPVPASISLVLRKVKP